MKHGGRLQRTVAVCALVTGACGTDGVGNNTGYALTSPEPYPEHLVPGTHVRTLIVRSEDRTGTGSDRMGTTCALDALLFDVNVTPAVAPTTLDAASGCNLYTNVTPESAYAMEPWICAGEITVGTGTGALGIGLCPTSAPPTFSHTFPCSDITLSGLPLSANAAGIPGAVLTSLTDTVVLPAGVTITEPGSLSISTWPTSGDLTVAWTSIGATSAEVRLQSQGTGAPITIVCTPHTSGTQVIPASLIAQANFRQQVALLRVVSVRDTTVTAEGGLPYRVSGATASSVLLQALP